MGHLTPEHKDFRCSEGTSLVTCGRGKKGCPCTSMVGVREEPLSLLCRSGRLHGGGVTQLSLEMQKEICQLEKREDLVWGFLRALGLSRAEQVGFFLSKK